LHHLLNNLIPPIDQHYTFRFLTGQKAVHSGDQCVFLGWFLYLAEIAQWCDRSIDAVTGRAGMATGTSKMMDNAIIGFMQAEDASQPGADLPTA
jgi:hypothetical protein